MRKAAGSKRFFLISEEKAIPGRMMTSADSTDNGKAPKRTKYTADSSMAGGFSVTSGEEVSQQIKRIIPHCGNITMRLIG